MTDKICREILNLLADLPTGSEDEISLSYANKIAGLTETMKVDGKKFPVTFNMTYEQCQNGYIGASLVPNEGDNGILYFEEGNDLANIQSSKNPYLKTRKTTISLIYWCNRQRLGFGATEKIDYGLEQMFLAKIKKRISTTDFDTLLNYKGSRKKADVFPTSRYSYQDILPLLYFPPFTAIALDFDVEFTDKCNNQDLVFNPLTDCEFVNL